MIDVLENDQFLVKWADNRFKNMILRPAMYVGYIDPETREIDQRGMDAFEGLVMQLLEIKAFATNKHIGLTFDKYRNYIQKFKVGSYGLSFVCKTEKEFIARIALAWTHVFDDV